VSQYDLQFAENCIIEPAGGQEKNVNRVFDRYTDMKCTQMHTEVVMPDYQHNLRIIKLQSRGCWKSPHADALQMAILDDAGTIYFRRQFTFSQHWFLFAWKHSFPFVGQ
jgi:hypothetical protein